MVWLGFMAYQLLWLFNAKSSLYIYIKNIWFGLVEFYGISTIVGYLMPNPFYTYILNILFGWDVFYGISIIVGYLRPNPLYTYILNIYDLVWLGFMVYQLCSLFNAKSNLYIYIRYIQFGVVGFYGISTIVGYLMPNTVYK